MSGLLASALALAACQAGAPGTSPKPAGASPSPRATRAPGVVDPTAMPGATPGATPAAVGSFEKLQRPAGATAVIKGRLQLDAAYMVAAGAGNAVQIAGKRAIAADGGTLIGLDGGSLVANARNQIVAAGAGNVIARTATLIGNAGNTLIGLDGGSLVGNAGNTLIGLDGSSLVGNAGNTLVGNAGNTYRLAQDAAGAAGVERAPVVGALVGAIDLRTRQPVPLGTDADGGKVYLVYSDVAGGFELFLPPDTAKNVLVVAAPPGTRDGRLAVNVLVPEAGRGDVAADELRSLVTDYLRACLAVRLDAAMTAPDPVKAVSQDPVVQAVLATVLPDLVRAANAAGFGGLPAGARRRAVQAGLDHVLADMDLGTVTILPERMGRNPYGDNALEAMRRALGEIERAGGARTLGPDSDVMALANQLRPADRAWRLARGHDLNELLVRGFVIQPHDAWFDLIGVAALEVGADPRVEDAIAAAGLAFFIDTAIKCFRDRASAEATIKAVVDGTVAEVAAARPDPVEGPTPAAPAGPTASATAFAALPGEPEADEGAPFGRKWPVGLALDERGAAPTLYAADRRGHQVWRLAAGKAPVPLFPAAADAFAEPSAVAVGPDGALYVADRKRHCVYVVRDPGGTPQAPTLVAGRPGEKGLADPAPLAGAEARLDAPEGLALGPDGALYVAEAANHVVRRIDLAAPDRRTAIFAGGVDLAPRSDGSTKPTAGYVDDLGRKARFKAPAGLAFGPRGLFVADREDARLRLAALPPAGGDEAGPVTYVAGGMWDTLARPSGPAFATRIDSAPAVAADAGGRVYIAGAAADPLRVLLPGSWLQPVAGVAVGTIVAPSGLALSKDGKTLYVANAGDRRIHALTLAP